MEMKLEGKQGWAIHTLGCRPEEFGLDPEVGEDSLENFESPRVKTRSLGCMEDG